MQVSFFSCMTFSGIVYLRVAPNGKYYVGQTIDEAKRQRCWLDVKFKYGGSLIMAARRKYPPCLWEYKVLARIWYPTIDSLRCRLDYLESMFISEYSSNDRTLGYNLTDGGGGTAGYKFSATSKRLIGDKNSKAVCKYTLTGEFVCEYASAVIASKDVGVNSSQIGKCCLGRVASAGGFLWCFSGATPPWQLDPNYNFPKALRRRKSVACYSLDGTFIRSYNSISSASRDTGVYVSAIQGCCSGVNLTAGGFQWKYVASDLEFSKTSEELSECILRRRGRPIAQYLGDSLVAVYSSRSEACCVTGITNIGASLRGINRQSGGFVWRYL